VVVASAPLLGILATCLGIVGSFRGLGTEKWTAIAAICWSIAESLIPTVLGLLVGLVAFVGYRCLRAQVEALPSEMEDATADLLNQLSRLRSSC